MVDQASVEYQRNGRSASEGVHRGMAALAGDLITLVELQCQLLLHDLSKSKTRLIAAVGMFAIAGVLALGAVPVLLMACAAGLEVMWPDLPSWAAMLIPAAVALIFGGALGWFGYRKIMGAVGAFGRSRQELAENMQALKAALRRA